MSLTKSIPILISFALLMVCSLRPIPFLARKRHGINFRHPNLYPEAVAYDPSSRLFIVGSIRHRTIHTISDDGVTQILISDHSLPENASFVGLTIDSVNNRLLAVVHSLAPLPHFNALASYDLHSRDRIFLSLLPHDDSIRHVANDVAVDFKGNAFVTNSAGNFIWKVNPQGDAGIFSRSPLFTQFPVDKNLPYNECGLNGIAHISKGYLLVAQSNTGKMFKVDPEDGTARLVSLTEDLIWADGVAVSSDGVALVVSHKRLWYVKSDDNWGKGVVYDRVALDEEGFASDVVVGEKKRVYVLYGRVIEGIMGKNEGVREDFRIDEVRSEGVRVYALIGLGLFCFMFWMFELKKLSY